MKLKDLKKQYVVIAIDRLCPSLGEVTVWYRKNKYCKTIEEAKKTIEEHKRRYKQNKPMVVNGIGIETEKVDHDFEYHIEWRWISKWERVEGE